MEDWTVATQLLWRVRYQVFADDKWSMPCAYQLIADDVGTALLAFHKWVQIKMKTPVSGYKVLTLHRLLRGVDKNGDKCVVGELENTGFPEGNPVVAVEAPAILPDKTEPFQFLAEVPVTAVKGGVK